MISQYKMTNYSLKNKLQTILSLKNKLQTILSKTKWKSKQRQAITFTLKSLLMISQDTLGLNFLEKNQKHVKSCTKWKWEGGSYCQDKKWSWEWIYKNLDNLYKLQTILSGNLYKMTNYSLKNKLQTILSKTWIICISYKLFSLDKNLTNYSLKLFSKSISSVIQ